MLPSPSNLFLAHHQAHKAGRYSDYPTEWMPSHRERPDGCVSAFHAAYVLVVDQAGTAPASVLFGISGQYRHFQIGSGALHPRWQLVSPTAQRRPIIKVADCTPFVVATTFKKCRAVTRNPATRWGKARA